MLTQPPPSSYEQQLRSLQKALRQMQPPAYMPNQQVLSPAPQQIHYVDGIAGAKEYQDKMMPNTSEIIMDKNEDVFYPVSKDANGTVPKLMTLGRFQLEQEAAEEPAYLTKRDLEDFKAELLSLLNKENKT